MSITSICNRIVIAFFQFDLPDDARILVKKIPVLRNLCLKVTHDYLINCSSEFCFLLLFNVALLSMDKTTVVNILYCLCFYWLWYSLTGWSNRCSSKIWSWCCHTFSSNWYFESSTGGEAFYPYQFRSQGSGGNRKSSISWGINSSKQHYVVWF